MIQLSKFFKNDVAGNVQTLKPIILITEPKTNDVIFTLTQDKEELFDINGNKIDIISCINKVSNVRLSTDYDTKTLKINRLRCTLYNYYDVKYNLSEVITDSLSSKNLYLFYKSPTTNVIDIQNNLNDYDCAMVYKGEISRLEFNDSSITILAEDKTQIKIANKTVPYMSIDKLDSRIKNNLTEKYKKNDAVVPITFGRVDKAPCIVYYDNNTNRIMNVLVDVFPTSDTHKTSKIPSVLGTNFFNNPIYNYYIYIKQNNDYIILNHLVHTRNLQNNKYSRFEISSPKLSTSYLFPELQEDFDEDFDTWDFKAFQQRLAVSAVASDGSILDVKTVQENNIDNIHEHSNIERVYNNNGKPKNWYRSGDNLHISVQPFVTGNKIYNHETGIGEGRWVAIQLEGGVNLDLVNIQVNGQWAGNTWNMCSWRIANFGGDFYEDYPYSYEKIGWYIAPLASEIWKDLDIPDTLTTINSQEIFNKIMVTTNEDIELPPSPIDSSQPYEICPIYINTTNLEWYRDSSNFWGEYNTTNFGNTIEYKNINGLYYGQKGSSQNVRLETSANSHNLIGMFEFNHAASTSDVHSYMTSLSVDNFALLHSVVAEEINKKELYLSITGRKNHLYTQQLNQEEYGIEIEYDLTLDDYLSGNVDDEYLLESFATTIRTTWETVLLQGNVDSAYSVNVADPVNTVSHEDFQANLSSFLETKIWREHLTSEFTSLFGLQDAPPIVSSYALFEKIFEYYLIPTRVIKNLDAHRLAADDFNQASYGPLVDAMQSFPQFYSNFHNLGWNPQGLTMQHDQNDYYENPTWSLSFAKYVYEYILQKNIDYDVHFETQICYVTNIQEAMTFGGFLSGQGKQYTIGNNELILSANTGRARVVLDLTSKIEEYKEYSWDSFEINSFDDWINNFYVYMDDLIQAINKALIEDFQSIGNTAGYFNYSVLPSEYIAPPNVNMEEWADSNLWVRGLGALDNDNEQLDMLYSDVSSYTKTLLESEQPSEDDILGTGVIEKPSDIVMNILVNELGYAKYFENQNLGDVLAPDYDQFDMDSIIESRDIHTNWKMGFSIDKKTDGKKLIENILKESKSYPKFTNDGKFGLINIKESYTNDDIDVIIKPNDILDYKFSETKREDVTTFIKGFYRFDYGLKRYNNDIRVRIDDLLPDYFVNQNNNYNIENNDGHRDLNLKYHTENETVKNFINYKLLNDCNTHSLVNLKLSLNYMNLTSGDILYLPLINNEQIFNTDYSKVYYKNSQPVYPLWLIMETNVGVDSIKIKAYQLHYLGTDGNHGFQNIVVENGKIQSYEQTDIIGNTNEFNSTYAFVNGQAIPNSNYNPLATIDNGVEIPYFDLTSDGSINDTDLNILNDALLGNIQLTDLQLKKLSYYPDGSNLNLPSVGTNTYQEFLALAYQNLQEIILHNV